MKHRTFPRGYINVKQPNPDKLCIDDTWETNESYYEISCTTISVETDIISGDKVILEWYKGMIDNPNEGEPCIPVSGHRYRHVPFHHKPKNPNFDVEVAWYSENRGVTHNISKGTYYEFYVTREGKVVSQCDASRYGNPNNRHVKAVMIELAKRKPTIDEF